MTTGHTISASIPVVLEMHEIHPASFRDPAGFIFESGGQIYRQINQVYKSDYDHLISSGLFEKLVSQSLVVEHTEVSGPVADPATVYKVVQVEPIRFISYPYEWCFSQYKDAALLTLRLQREALQHGMILKDASAYNIQFHRGRPILIDTLSFTRYEEGTPWVGYRQFCQHFLAPLALMSLVDIRLSKLLTQFIDGIPLDLASRLLPFSTRFKPGLLTHIHLHAGAQSRYAGTGSQEKKAGRRISKLGLLGLIDNLESTIRKLTWSPKSTDWSAYYQHTNYSDASFEAKKQTVKSLMREVAATSILDLGANTGVFSRLADGDDSLVISADFDPGAVELNYLEAKRAGTTHILPLVMDITNPSPDIGWHGQERSGFFRRGPFDLVMALALIHHLAISNNVPLRMIARTMAALGRYLIIEFVPKSDSQVQRLLASRDDIFPGYTIDGFRDAFSHEFAILKEVPLQDSQRTLFLLQRR